MERVRGLILRRNLPDGLALPNETARKLSESFIDNLAALHGLDYAELGLGELGKPQGYLERQVRGWMERYQGSKTHDLPEVEPLSAWLREHMPSRSDATLIHNDYKYDNMVLDHEPQIGNRVEVNLQDQLLSLGWDVTNDAGNRVDGVFPGKKYHFRLYYKVLAPIPGEWETFIHIDGFQRRFNGDHKTLGGKYSFSLWQTGDYIVDDSEFSVEPNFTRGDYNVYYGLFVGETRLKVKTGPHQDNRIEGGRLHVVN